MAGTRKRIPEVDAYVAEAPDFARPILRKLRTLFHRGCPRLTETIKWGAPFFEHEGLVGSMAAFKRHVALGFWRGAELADPAGLLAGVGNTQMSMIKVGSLADLPQDDVLVAYVAEAAALNEQRSATPRARHGRATAPRPPPAVPADLAAALGENRRAAATFEAFAPSGRREYVEWIEEAKRRDTRERRIAQAVAWMSEGKSRTWKYRKDGR
jgi:hypothetical protein